MTQLFFWIGAPGNPETPAELADEAKRLGYQPLVEILPRWVLNNDTGRVDYDELEKRAVQEIDRLYPIPNVYDYDGPIFVDIEQWKWVVRENGPVSGADHIHNISLAHDRLRSVFPRALTANWAVPFLRWRGYEPPHQSALNRLFGNVLLGHCSAYMRQAWLAKFEWWRTNILDYRMEGIRDARKPALVSISPMAFHRDRSVTMLSNGEMGAVLAALKPYRPAYIVYWFNRLGAQMQATHGLDERRLFKFLKRTLEFTSKTVEGW